MNKRILATLFSLVCIIGGTILAIKYAQGYRPTTTGSLKATGLLAANSFPNGASVYINGNLTSATDTTLNLDPGDYDIEIKKDGYTPWKKRVHIEKELVVQTNAVLFPTAPSLTPLTFTGAENLTPSPDGQQILYTTASSSATKNNGIYVMNMTDSPIALQRSPVQIAQNAGGIDLSQAQILWSPESTEVLVSVPNRTWLLSTTRQNDLETVADVTIRKNQILAEWQDLFEKKQVAALKLFPPEVAAIATASARYFYISPDQERVLYSATASTMLQENLISSVPAANTQEQRRDIEVDGIYVYDRHEDRNFLVGSENVVTVPTASPLPRTTTKKAQIPVPTKPTTDAFMDMLIGMRNKTSGLFVKAPQWLPDSKHLIFATTQGIEIAEYDGTNRARVYAGPFEQGVVYPWPNGSKLMILTNFNEPTSGILNLYAVGIK